MADPVPATRPPRDCKHGHQARKCDLCDLERDVATLRETLLAARLELDRWGHGDFHYGFRPRDLKVVAMIGKIDEVLDDTL